MGQIAFMKTFKTFMAEASQNTQFNNWVMPKIDDIKLEYKVEYQLKNLKGMTNDAFPTEKDFIEAVQSAKKVTVTPSINKKISYRSNTGTQSQLLDLIRSYRSYPQYRNEKTIQALYDGFAENKPMKMPMVLKFFNGKMRVLGGNTRMDVAFQLGINPVVLMIEVPQK